MVETTLDIGRHSAITTNVKGTFAQQAELVAFGHYVARMVSLLGPAGARAVVDALRASATPLQSSVNVSALARYVDGAAGPRIYFRLKTRDAGAGGDAVRLLLEALLARHHRDKTFGPRLWRLADLLAGLAATGQIRSDNEFDVALATTDVAWRDFSDVTDEPAELSCPACGSQSRFELRVWPSDAALIRRCSGCGAGVWRRNGHGARLIRADVWAAMESMRSELGGTPAEDDVGRSLLGELKRVFAENGWPYSEIDGVPVLVSELSGPEGSWDFYAQVVEEKGIVLLYSIAPQHVPEHRRLEAAEFLTRANYGLAEGNFELDFADGEVRYKTVLHVDGDNLDSLVLKRLVCANGIALETYLPSLRALS